MKLLWAPWRHEYVKKAAKEEDCFFCVLAGKKEGLDSLILAKGKYCFTVMNKYPYNPGHLLIAPYKHTSSIHELDSRTWEEIRMMLIKCIESLNSTLKPDGFNIGINIGRAAGAGVIGHIHLHVVPRWNGDTNFMSTLADTKVISASLASIYKLLSKKMRERR